jgi:hypothetical protein
MEDDQEQRPESLLPYDEWTEEALRHVVVSALSHAARSGLPGEHHFYLTFRTDHPQVSLPARLRAQYPQEMTIILQHQFWDLKVEDDRFSVGLSFGGVPTTLVIPFVALTAFADPHVRYGLRFRVILPAAAPAKVEAPVPAVVEEETPQVVSLDAFRRRPAIREGSGRDSGALEAPNKDTVAKDTVAKDTAAKDKDPA